MTRLITLLAGPGICSEMVLRNRFECFDIRK